MTIYDLQTKPCVRNDNALRRIPSLPGERWYGGAVNDGAAMPFQHPYRCDLRANLKGNQATPLLLSSSGRYLWSEYPFAFEIDDRGGLIVEHEGELTLWETSGGGLRSAFRAASRRHFPPSGRLPDRLNFSSPQYNSWIEMGYDPTQTKILSYAGDILTNSLPPGVMMIDDNWFVDNGTLRFDLSRFSNPVAMVAQLHSQGFALMLWVSPFISPDSCVFRELSGRNLLVRCADGSPAVRAWWNGYSALLDVSHPEAIEWLHSGLTALQSEYGVDGFKFDAGDPEYIFESDMTYGSLTPTGYCQAWAEIGLRYNRFNEYRACWKLAGQSLVHRLRDKQHAWGRDGLADIVPNGLAQGLAGYPFICPDMVGGGDIGSFTRPGFVPDQELLVRTLQCSALFPIVQFSIAPWRLLDKLNWGYCLDAIRTRQSLVPTILDLAGEAAVSGEPILRHLSYVFPGCGYESISNQFMLGDEILVAPVVTKGADSRPIVFPPGSWADENAETIVGPCLREVYAPISRLPWYRLI